MKRSWSAAAIGAMVLVVGGCAGTQTQDAVKPLPTENYGYGGPEAPIICFEADGCVPEGAASPVTAYRGFHQIAEALHKLKDGTSCPTDQGPQAELQCQEQQASGGGTTGGATPPASPTNRPVALMAGSVTSVTTVSGAPVPATPVAGVKNTGNTTLTVTASHFVLPQGSPCSGANPPGPESGVEGIDVTPEQSGPFTVPPGAFVMHTLDIDVEDSVPVGQYEICTIATGYSYDGAMVQTTATAALNVVNVPLKIDQSKMPTNVMPATADLDGTITITNLSPTKYQGVLIVQQFTPGADVAVRAANLDDGACVVSPGSAQITCTAAALDRGDQADLDMKFCTKPGWTGKLISSVTVTVVGNPGSANSQTIGDVSSAPAASGPAPACP